jgi:hypothetical protein
MSEQENIIWASCFVSQRTRKGMVSLRIKEHEVQLSTEEARELANNIARAAEAAETDEMCMALMGDDVGIHLIRLMRDYREVKIGIQKAEWTPAEIAEKLKASCKST